MSWGVSESNKLWTDSASQGSFTSWHSISLSNKNNIVNQKFGFIKQLDKGSITPFAAFCVPVV